MDRWKTVLRQGPPPTDWFDMSEEEQDRIGDLQETIEERLGDPNLYSRIILPILESDDTDAKFAVLDYHVYVPEVIESLFPYHTVDVLKWANSVDHLNKMIEERENNWKPITKKEYSDLLVKFIRNARHDLAMYLIRNGVRVIKTKDDYMRSELDHAIDGATGLNEAGKDMARRMIRSLIRYGFVDLNPEISEDDDNFILYDYALDQFEQMERMKDLNMLHEQRQMERKKAGQFEDVFRQQGLLPSGTGDLISGYLYGSRRSSRRRSRRRSRKRYRRTSKPKGSRKRSKVVQGTRVTYWPSTRKNKKWMTVSPSGKTIHWGHPTMKDFTQHKSRKRRKNYRSRHAGIKLKDGSRAIDKKWSPAWLSYYVTW